MNWQPLILTFQLASVTTIVLFLLATPLAAWLSTTTSKLKPVVETIVSMPLVLPPTVIGFYLLIAFSPNNAFGTWLNEVFGISLLFSFSGLVIASVIYSFPFMVHPIQSGLSNLSPYIREAAQLLGKSKTSTYYKVLLPCIKPSLYTGIVLSFAHSIGEFGVVLMIGGSIPGKTKVASIEIYDQVEAMNYAAANNYSIILFSISFAVLLLVYAINGGLLKRFIK